MIVRKKKQNLKSRCEGLLARIRKDFPALNRVRIHIKIKRLKKGSLWANTILHFYYLIIVDPNKYRDAKDKELIGGLAHELIHLEDYKKMNFFRWLFSFIHYYASKKYAKKVERNIEIKVIKRGYGKYLLLNREFRLKRISTKEFKKIGKNYLTPEEIKIYMKKLRR